MSPMCRVSGGNCGDCEREASDTRRRPARRRGGCPHQDCYPTPDTSAGGDVNGVLGWCSDEGLCRVNVGSTRHISEERCSCKQPWSRPSASVASPSPTSDPGTAGGWTCPGTAP